MGRKKNKNMKGPLIPQKHIGGSEAKVIKYTTANKNLLETNSTLPIDIISRLNFPFLKPRENDDISDDDEEEFEFSFRPRLVFSCSLCLVCLEFCDDSASCEACGMVSYCSVRLTIHLKINNISLSKLIFYFR